MIARLNSTCPVCRNPIRARLDEIVRGPGAFKHRTCPTLSNEPDADSDDRRLDREYRTGAAEVAAIQACTVAGSELREQMYLDMELAAYNRGEDY